MGASAQSNRAVGLPGIEPVVGLPNWI